MKSINLLIQLGNSLTHIQSEIAIFGLTKSSQVPLMKFKMDCLSKKVDIEAEDNYEYYYALADITSFTSGRQNYNAADGQKLQLLSVFKKTDDVVKMNEYITVANMFCFTQSMSSDETLVLKHTNRVLGLSMGMRDNFVSTSGEISDVITSSPNGFETNSYALWMSLANLTYNCYTNQTTYNDFIKYSSIDSNKPASFLEGLYNIIRNPFTSVPEIYELIENNPVVFHPSLTKLSLPQGASRQPDQWTLAIKVHNSGADNYLFAGVAYIAFDKNDRGWVANNVVQGTPNSASCCMVLEPNGKPAEFSPVFGGGIVGVGFGVTVDNEGENIYFGSFGWGPTQCNPFEGALAQFSNDGTTLSPTNGWTKGLSRVQGLNFDKEGNLWVTSWGSQEPLAPGDTIYPFENKESAIVVFKKGDNGNLDFDNPLSYPLGNPFRATFDVAYNPVSDAMYVACAGTARGKGESGMSSVYKFTLENDIITLQASWDKVHDSKNARLIESFRQINFDSDGNVYVGAIKEGEEPIFIDKDTKKQDLIKAVKSGIIKLDSNLVFQEKITDKINRPWSVTIDNNDTIFAGNFGPELVKEHKFSKDLPLGTTGVTIVKKDSKGKYVSQFMTLPTGGSEVKLATGFPLYGIVYTTDFTKDGKEIQIPIQRPCYSPLMRITSSSVDGAGNLWVNNNWKPSGAIDLLENPGGDGLVIFIGVAAPEPYRF